MSEASYAAGTTFERPNAVPGTRGVVGLCGVGKRTDPASATGSQAEAERRSGRVVQPIPCRPGGASMPSRFVVLVAYACPTTRWLEASRP